ncbi:MAG: hypothetical protein ACRDFX_05720 [Chloroflexota bacterium]
MRRIIIVAALVLFAVLAGAERSHAAITTVNGSCFDSPFNQLVACNPTPTGLPTVPLVATPTKELSVSGPLPGPNNTTNFGVTIRTELTCFALPENTDLYTLSSPGSAAFNELAPTPGAESGQSVSVQVDQNILSAGAGTARLSLEVSNASLGTEGVTVKAVWPLEKIERLINVIPPATPTATATPVPGATNTPVPTPTVTPSPTPSPTPTPTVTGTPEATSTPVISAETDRSCITPPYQIGETLGGQDATFYGLTIPGSVCTGAVEYLDRTSPAAIDGLPRLADAAGIVQFSFVDQSFAGGGIANVQCSIQGETASSCTGFLVLQKTDSNLTDLDKQKLYDQIQGLAQQDCASLFG